jgi:hypothetical protein
MWFKDEKLNVRMVSSKSIVESSETSILTLYSHQKKLAGDKDETKKYEYGVLR